MRPGIIKKAITHSEIQEFGETFHGKEFLVLFSVDIGEAEIRYSDFYLPRRRIHLIYDGSDFLISTSPGVRFSQHEWKHDEETILNARDYGILLGRPTRGTLLCFDEVRLHIRRGSCLLRSILSPESGHIGLSSNADYERVSNLMRIGFRIPVIDAPIITVGGSSENIFYQVKIKTAELEPPKFKKLK